MDLDRSEIKKKTREKTCENSHAPRKRHTPSSSSDIHKPLSVQQVLVQILSHLKAPDLNAILRTNKSMRALASDPVLQTLWLNRHYNLHREALVLAARKGLSSVMIRLINQMGMSATAPCRETHPLPCCLEYTSGACMQQQPTSRCRAPVEEG